MSRSRYVSCISRRLPLAATFALWLGRSGVTAASPMLLPEVIGVKLLLVVTDDVC
jgi:hypothetical protein